MYDFVPKSASISSCCRGVYGPNKLPFNPDYQQMKSVHKKWPKYLSEKLKGKPHKFQYFVELVKTIPHDDVIGKGLRDRLSLVLTEVGFINFDS